MIYSLFVFFVMAEIYKSRSWFLMLCLNDIMRALNGCHLVEMFGVPADLVYTLFSKLFV